MHEHLFLSFDLPTTRSPFAPDSDETIRRLLQDTIVKTPATDSTIWSSLSTIFDRLPSGTIVNAECFPEHFGTEAARLLNTLSIDSIQVTDAGRGTQHYKLIFAHPDALEVPKGIIIHDSTIDFELRRDQDGIRISRIKGLHVKKDAHSLTATIDSIELTQQTNGNLQLIGKGHWGIFHGSKIFVLDSTGKFVPEK